MRCTYFTQRAYILSGCRVIEAVIALLLGIWLWLYLYEVGADLFERLNTLA